MKHIHTFFDQLFSTNLIILLAIIFSVASWYISFTNNYVLTYNDAASHLNIARRIVDNYTPGIAQIGTVWLPFPHVLMLLFAWQDTLWRTAIAGSIVSMAAYVISVVYIYKTILLISGKKIGAFIGSLILALNPNMLYLQGTPMTETLLISTFVMAGYFLANYLKKKTRGYLILTAVAVMLSTLIRYDGWFLYAILALIIPIIGYFTIGWKKAEGDFILFVTMGGVGILLWVIWNYAIFADPLYFITGPYSAYAQQQVLKSVGQLPTEGNIYNALYYYSWAVLGNIGWIISVTALIVALILPFVIKQKKQLAVVFAVLSPFLFNLIALYVGQSALNVPQAPINPGMFNTRYGIMMLPGFALLIGLLISSARYTFLFGLIILIIQSIIFFKEGMPLTLVDGVNGLKNTYYTVEASSWLKQNYDEGLILTTLASHDAFVARAQIPMRNYIHEGNREHWDQALNNPSQKVKYIALLIQPPDSVYRRLKDNADFKKNFTLVHEYKEFKIFKRK